MAKSKYSIYGISARDKFTAIDAALKAFVCNDERSTAMEHAQIVTNLYILRDDAERDAMEEAEKEAADNG